MTDGSRFFSVDYANDRDKTVLVGAYLEKGTLRLDKIEALDYDFDEENRALADKDRKS